MNLWPSWYRQNSIVGKNGIKSWRKYRRGLRLIIEKKNCSRYGWGSDCSIEGVWIKIVFKVTGIYGQELTLGKVEGLKMLDGPLCEYWSNLRKGGRTEIGRNTINNIFKSPGLEREWLTCFERNQISSKWARGSE